MKKMMLLSVLMLSTAAYSEPLDLSIEFEWDDDLEVKEEKSQDIPSKDLSPGEDDYDFLTEVDFDLEDWEESEIPKNNHSEEEIMFVLIEDPIDSNHTISEVDFDLEQLPDEEPIEIDIIFASSGVSHKEPIQVKIEEIALAEIPTPEEEIVSTGQKDEMEWVTNREYAEFVNGTGHRPPSHWGSTNPPVNEEDQPVVNVSYKDAYLYVVWAGGRLPMDSELRKPEVSREFTGDRSQPMGEWTATPARANKSQTKGQAGAQYVPGHLVFTNEKNDSLALTNSDSNPHTGFRFIGKKQK